MKVRRVSFALVSAAFLAAIATTCGTSYASPAEDNAKLAREGYVTLQQGDAQAALVKFNQAIDSGSLEPEVAINALLNRALAYQQLNDHNNAIKDYSRALSMDVMAPSLRATALYNRGLSYQKTALLPKAIEDFTASLLLQPTFAEAYFSRANALRDSGQLLFALSDYERALRNKHPSAAQVYYGTAMTYLALKRPVDAKKALNAALSLNPQYGQARAQLILLGDQNAEATQAADADPMATGSVSPVSGGTLVTKPNLPAAVAPPAELQAASAEPVASKKAKKKFNDRVLPEGAAKLETASTTASPAHEEVVAIEQVPEIPAPVGSKPKASEPVSDEASAINTPAPAKKKAKVTASQPAVQEASAEQAPAAETTSNANLGAWTVQLASAASEDAAWSVWKKMQSKYSVLESVKPAVVRADLGDKGIYYRVRMGGFDDQNSAKSACSKLKAKGVKCYISKTES